MGKDLSKTTHTFLFCDGGSCQKKGSEQVVRTARAYLRNNGLWDTTHTIKTRCNGRCEDAPTCIVSSNDYWYKELTPKNIIPILKSHIEKNEPVEAHLLHKKDWEEMTSDNERAPIKPKPFELKNDENLDECYTTKGFSSDQYLYPLFLFLKENPKGVFLHLVDASPISFEEIINVDYATKYNVVLTTNTAVIPLTIAAVPKEEKDLQQSKITSTEYFYQTKTKQTGIRFKNKFGKLIGKILFDSIDNKGWQYCTSIQLLNTKLDLA